VASSELEVQVAPLIQNSEMFGNRTSKIRYSFYPGNFLYNSQREGGLTKLKGVSFIVHLTTLVL
jgi:hypothetical protein